MRRLKISGDEATLKSFNSKFNSKFKNNQFVASLKMVKDSRWNYWLIGDAVKDFNENNSDGAISLVEVE